MNKRRNLNIDGVGSRTNHYIYNHRLSYAKKKAHDFKWVEEMTDLYDYWYGRKHFLEKRKKLRLNYNLYNGRGESAMKDYVSSLRREDLSDLGIEAGYDEVQHHDIISSVAKAMVGEQRKRPLQPMAIDRSGYVLNQRKRKRTGLYQDYLKQKIIAPLHQESVIEYLSQYGIKDIYALTPEQQQQMQADITRNVQAKTPKEINEFLRKDYKAPSEIQAQRLIDFLIKEFDVKFFTDENFKHMIISGSQIYKIGVRQDEPYFELVNADGFTYEARPNSFFIEEGEWAKYEQEILFSDFFTNFGDQLKERDFKKLDGLVFSGKSDDAFSAKLESDLVGVISDNEAMIPDNFDIRNRDGQEFVKSLHERLGTNSSYVRLRHVNVAYKSLRKLKQIHRVVEDKLEKFWVDESYTFNKLKGDIKEVVAWVPEVWECDKFGTIDALYLNKRPVPYQYRSLQNPWKVNLPYYGVELNRLMKNTENVAPIDHSKPWQFKFNVQIAKIHESESTDLGKVLLTSFGALPKGWTWGKFLQMMRYGKIAPLDFQQEGMNPADHQAIRSVDLSNMGDIVGRLNYLEWIKNQVALAMSYNPSRLGQISPYTAVGNNQQNIIQSSHQTEDIYTTHNKVVERVLNALMSAARIAYKNNPKKLSYLLDDMSVAELELDWEMLARSEIGIKVSNNSEDFHNINLVKNHIQPMIQNGLISLPELVRVLWSKSYGDVINIAEQAEERAQKQRQQAQQEQVAMMDQQAAMQRQLEEQKAQLALLMQQREIAKDIMVTEIDAQKFALQHDINRNQVNDAIEKTKLEMKYKKELEDKKLKLENRKLEVEREIKNKELEIKKLALRVKKKAS